VVLNTIVADAIDELCTELEKTVEKDGLEASLSKVLAESFAKCKDIIFNGDGYSEDWQKVAKERGLLNLKTTADALPKLKDKKNIELFDKYSVLSEREVESRLEIWAEQYVTTLNIEVDTTEAIAKTMVYPAAVRYLEELSNVVKNGKETGIKSSGAESMLKTVSEGLDNLGKALDKLRKVQETLKAETALEQAAEYRDKIIPVMTEIRDAVDFLERYVADDYWPLPIYREMLFVK
jgi:glutamine synthetase